jgi:FkbM family methyltransferase
MKVRIRRLLAPVARVVVGTPLEGAAYGVWNLFTRGSWPKGAAEYDRLTVLVIRRVLSPSGNGIDVGAHRGTVLRHMVDASPSGRHFAVEPLPAFAAGLRRRFPQVEVCQVALADEPGEAVFHHVVTNPSYSGLSRRSYPEDGEVLRDIVVQVTRLDDLIPADLPVQFVKIDVEGGELAVVKGSRALLNRWHPVVVLEHGWDAGVPDPDTTDELWGEFDAAGLGLYKIAVWLEGSASPLSRQEFLDALAQGSYYFLAAPPDVAP